MKVNPFITSFESKDCFSFLVQPYKNVLPNFKIAFAKTEAARPISLYNRVKHLTVGAALAIPLFNSIVYLALQWLYKAPPKKAVNFKEEVRGRHYDKRNAAEDIDKISFTTNIR